MIAHWPWWLGALALASIPILHWLVLDRSFAVSGRVTALVDRLRHGTPREPALDVAALIAAARAETTAAFGEDAVSSHAPTTSEIASARLPSRDAPAIHLLFFAGLVLGGALSAALAGALVPAMSLQGEMFARVVSALGVPGPALLVFAGVLVGFGTRMASGCTSGHGLCGVSQVQPGSLLATAAFFGAGVAVSFALGALI